MRTKAFTLAETLITLGIIGIVAAITLPTLIANYQKKVAVEKLKKVYTTFSQAMVQSQAENGNPAEWTVTTQNSSYEENLKYFEYYWKPYLKVIKVCKTMNECGYTKNYFLTLKNTPLDYAAQRNNVPGFIYGDGTYAYIRPYSLNTTTLPELQMLCVDLNGPKGPNIIGKDIFYFKINISKSTLGNMDPVSYCTKAHFYEGRSCAGKIMQDGWTIKSDYPW